MSLARILEPEVMDSPDDAADYNSMDHREVNQRFVTDLLAAVPPAPMSSTLAPAPPRSRSSSAATMPIAA